MWNHVIDEVIGEQEPRKSVTGIRIREVNTDDVKELTTHRLFVAIGHDPATALFRGQLDMDDAGYIKVGSWLTKTTVPGGAGCRRCHRLGIPSGNHRCRHGKHGGPGSREIPG
ncbi:NAD(P)/FAD-dependent oxidoreductase [Sinorhizobium meliloti]|nr:NAD(P)/FAD-dependent oxidoreductase [Sinorhizobium meliloti]